VSVPGTLFSVDGARASIERRRRSSRLALNEYANTRRYSPASTASLRKIRQLRRRVCEQRRQLRGCNFGVIQGKMAGFSAFRVEMAGKASALARLTAGAHQLNSCEFSTSEPPPRGDRPPNNVLLGPPTPDLNISRLVLDRKSGRRMPFRFESQEPEVVPYFRSCR